MSIPLKEEEKTNGGGGSNILDVSVDEIEESETNNKDKSEEVSFIPKVLYTRFLFLSVTLGIYKT